ncbi:MAG: nucleotide pyrophosphohydrolase [Bacilli bacterium]|jgi:NTP pyrophosphatase (non-canonical NTP hydrolase)|nr:nucleotide pyrophosphohydrolase [Bacillota bacterium]NLM32041.1 nucleotide pyrophosphohydrolase [Acholeplasmataceae bacterium]HOA79110.1 nucleotide pyrophosphohydrolase [Bacilli bacterium]HPZ27357.1 nucleotide pyrophosphohydrolase [Bacilli bacterium]HQC89806.1 nucleotide pyrophosphohydrolase [Bacilli bacterium]
MNKKVMEKILDFRNERDWEQYHSGENLAKSLIIEAAELLELYQWGNEVENIERLKEELADVMIYALLLANRYKLDVEDIILKKIKKNAEKYPVKKAYGSAKKYNEL